MHEGESDGDVFFVTWKVGAELGLGWRHRSRWLGGASWF